MSHQLRAYQSGAISALREALQRLLADTLKKPHVLLVSPTGSGKTTIAGEMIGSATSRGKRVLFIAHRRELIDQCSQRLDGVGVDHGVIMSDHPRVLPGLPVQVGSVQTLARREQLPPAELIVVDEAHHARATTYGKILDRYPGVPVIGLTATPWRTDGKGLGELFEDLVVAARPRELIELGHLVPYDGFAYDVPSLDRVEKRGSDYDQHGLELVMGSRQLCGNIVKQYLEHAAGKLAVVFATTVAHSKELAERFVSAGVPAEHLDGETPVRDRVAILKRLAAGTTRVLCNVNVVTEGWDVPQLELCILARPTLSAGLYLQMVGRVMRPADGKKVARIHDHAGCVLEHGAPDMDRDYALNSDLQKQKRGERPPPLRTCEQCLRIYDPTLSAECPGCGHVNAPSKRELREIDDERVRAIPLSELPQFKDASPEKRRAHYEKLLAQSIAKGYAPGAAAAKYRAIYREKAPYEWGREPARSA